MKFYQTDHHGPILEINFDGSIAWHGPVSKAARAFLRSVKSVLDLDLIGNLAAERIYRRAIEKCLANAYMMDRDSYIKQLEQELEARNSKSVLMRLKDDGG